MDSKIASSRLAPLSRLAQVSGFGLGALVALSLAKDGRLAQQDDLELSALLQFRCSSRFLLHAKRAKAAPSNGYALSPLSSLSTTTTLALQEIGSFLPEIVQILTLIPIKETLMTEIKTQQSLFTIPTKEL